MEGFLQKWTNYMYGWKTRYCRLTTDGLFSYAKTKRNKMKVNIPVKQSTIKSVPNEPLRIIISYQNKNINLKAESLELKNKWLQTYYLFQAKEISDLVMLESTPKAAFFNDFDLCPNEAGASSVKSVSKNFDKVGLVAGRPKMTNIFDVLGVSPEHSPGWNGHGSGRNLNLDSSTVNLFSSVETISLIQRRLENQLHNLAKEFEDEEKKKQVSGVVESFNEINVSRRLLF
jgi:hypothetical protein